MGWGGSRRGSRNYSDEEVSGASDYSSDDQERAGTRPSRRSRANGEKKTRKPQRGQTAKSGWSSQLFASITGGGTATPATLREGRHRTRLRRKDSKTSKTLAQGTVSTCVWVLATILLLLYYFDFTSLESMGIFSKMASRNSASSSSTTGTYPGRTGKVSNSRQVVQGGSGSSPGLKPGAVGVTTTQADADNDPDQGNTISNPAQVPKEGNDEHSISNDSTASGTGESGDGRAKQKPEGGSINAPMNGRNTDLHVPGGVGRMDEATVTSYYRKLAKGYLETFTQGIYRHMFFDVLRRRTYSLTPPGANKGVQSMMFQIINKKVYLMDPYEVPKNSKPFYRKRINEIIWLLSKMATAGRIKNTEFMVSIHDCVQTVNKPHTYRAATYQESIPAFTIVSCNFSDNIPFPMWEGDAARGGGFAGWDKRMTEYATKSQQAWETKESKAVFRGGNRPSMFFKKKEDANQHCNEIGRTRLSYLATDHPNELDVSVGGTCGGVHRYLQRLDEFAQQRFKYVVYAEGNCFWADRLNKHVFGPSLIFKQETPCGQFWEPLLKPMTHYVPTDFHFDNLVDQIKWARLHDNVVQEIVRNANDFANNFLTLRGIESYIEVLLQEYTALLVEPEIKLESGAIEVTNKHV